MHPILEPLVVQLPTNSNSRKLIESGSDYNVIQAQLVSEHQWCKFPETADSKHNTGILNLFLMSVI